MQKQTTIKERLAMFLGYLNIGQAKFAEIIGVSRGFANNVGDSIRTENLNKISAVYPELNIAWLLTGEGDMLKDDAPPDDTGDVSTGKLVPLYDADAAAGQDYAVTMEPARPIGMIDVGGLLRDSDSALRVYGNSMIPNYPAGCIVGLKFYTERFIEPGYVYVVETSENRYLKRLYYNDDKTAYHCLSDNHMCYEDGPRKGRLFYPDFEIPLEDVRKVFRVVGVIKRNIL